MGIRENDGGGGGGDRGSGVRSGEFKRGDVWGCFIVEGDGSVGSVVASVVVNIVVFKF